MNGKQRPADAILRRQADLPVGGGAPTGPALPGLSVQFCQDEATPRGWMNAAIHLQVLTAIAGDATFLLPHGVAPDAIQVWHALGFQNLATRALPPGGAVAADLLWLDTADEATLPAEALAALRARIGQPAATGRKLFWRTGVAPGLEATLEAQGFEPVDAAALSAVAQIALVSQAAWIVGASGQIPLAFCMAGTRVVELADRAAFDGQDWMMAVKLGVMHGVLPCRLTAGGVTADAVKLAGLLRLLAARQ